MGRRWTAPRGWDVELITLDGRRTFRVRQYGVLAGDAASVAELERLLARAGLTMADLDEAD